MAHIIGASRASKARSRHVFVRKPPAGLADSGAVRRIVSQTDQKFAEIPALQQPYESLGRCL